MNDLKDFDNNIAKITIEQWQRLFKLIPVISRTKNFGKISPIRKTQEGYFTLAYIQPSPIVQRFQSTVYEIGIILDFDWAHWDEGKKILANPKTDFNKLDIKTLCMLITTIVRNDRFCEGSLVDAFEDGTMLRLLKALKINWYQINIQLNYFIVVSY